MSTTSLLLLVILMTLGRAILILGLEALCKTSWARSRAVYPQRPNALARRKQEHIIYFIGIIIEAVLFFLLVMWSHFKFYPTTLLGVVVLLLSFMFIVEPLYYVYHRLLHTKFLYKHHHIHHHQALVPTPISGFYFTLVERLSYTVLFISPIILLGLLKLLSIPLIVVYVLVFEVINALGHTNIKFSEKYQKSFWHLFLYSPNFHADHHKYFRTNYSLFMPLWDKLFGTYK